MSKSFHQVVNIKTIWKGVLSLGSKQGWTLSFLALKRGQLWARLFHLPDLLLPPPPISALLRLVWQLWNSLPGSWGTHTLLNGPLLTVKYFNADGHFLSPPEATSAVSPALTVKTAATDQVFEPANSLPSRSEAAAVQPVVGIGQRVKMRSNEKKDLGTLGYVLGLLMMVIIIAIGAGIVVGYVYKRGKDLKEQHEQKVYEREMQRITLPLSAFTNQACELVDENTIEVHTNQTPVEDTHNGDAPLMGQAGTPGA
uniref:Phosphoinositide-3-kinase interacting protein 1 n=1 Tax=Podarcis muralis TaxID=64176 RepID=A0A670JPS8_PODMU